MPTWSGWAVRGQTERIGMIVDLAVAGLAGGIADRLERSHMARSAIVLEARMRHRKVAARPDLVCLELSKGGGCDAGGRARP
jgi:hypothetical protein